MTPYDAAHAAMEAAPDDERARLAAFGQIAASELHLLLVAEPVGEQVEPQIFDTAEGRFVLAFDTEARLSDFARSASARVTLPGRRLVEMLAGQGIGLGLNLDVAPSAMLLPPEAVDWLAETLMTEPATATARPRDLCLPKGVPDRVLEALDTRLAATAGLASVAYLAAATYDDGRRATLLAFVDPAPGAEQTLARAVGEALIFSGLDAGELDVLFVAASDPVAATLARNALCINLPEPEVLTPLAPGSDPESPPTLR